MTYLLKKNNKIKLQLKTTLKKKCFDLKALCSQHVRKLTGMEFIS